MELIVTARKVTHERIIVENIGTAKRETQTYTLLELSSTNNALSEAPHIKYTLPEIEILIGTQDAFNHLGIMELGVKFKVTITKIE